MASSENIFTTKSKKQIVIIDNLYSFSEVCGIHKGVIGLNFKIANSADADVQNLANKRLLSIIDSTSLTAMHFFEPSKQEVIRKYIPEQYFRLNASYVNLGIRGATYETHVDSYWNQSGKTLIYYANKEWNRNWGGETMFFNDDGKEIEYITPLVPGRVVIFDSDIPHIVKEQSVLGPPYRFTIALKYINRQMND